MFKRFSTSLILFFILITSFAVAKTQKEEYQNDYLYSEAYFDYLIESAELEHDKEIEAQKKAQKELEEKIRAEEDAINDAIFLEEIEEDIETKGLKPFKLKIEADTKYLPYSETYKKPDTKVLIPLGNNFNFIQDYSTKKNKYNSHDYKILVGGEYIFSRYLRLSSGLETNYRNLDQNPESKKIYITPSLHFGDKVSLSFYNKLNIQTYAQNHDIGLNISPFKSKAMDFGIYAGTTRHNSGAHSQSINFSTSFYFF